MFDAVVMFQGTIYEKGYGQIARAVMRDKELKPTAKAIYAYICSFGSNSNSGDKTAFPSVELQIAELGISEETYYKHRKTLIEKGYLRIEKQTKNDKGKWERNLYIICAVPAPQNIEYGEKIDLEPFEPHPKFSGTAEPHPNFPSTENPHTEKSGTITTRTITTSTKKELISSSSSKNNFPMQNLIDEALKSEYAEVPFDEIKETLLSDENVVIETIKQYKAMLEYRLKNWKPRKQPVRGLFKPKAPIRTEHTPAWFKEAEEYYSEPKEDDSLKKTIIAIKLKITRGEELTEEEEILWSIQNRA